uniref:Uncharacterized protein n=1 Tax=Anopheles atroparvus TaxID=41427 RepID=A0A182IJL6_ANOAO
MDILPSGSIFRELQIIHETGCFSSESSIEDQWQQGCRIVDIDCNELCVADGNRIPNSVTGATSKYSLTRPTVQATCRDQVSHVVIRLPNAAGGMLTVYQFFWEHFRRVIVQGSGSFAVVIVRRVVGRLQPTTGTCLTTMYILLIWEAQSFSPKNVIGEDALGKFSMLGWFLRELLLALWKGGVSLGKGTEKSNTNCSSLLIFGLISHDCFHADHPGTAYGAAREMCDTN